MDKKVLKRIPPGDRWVDINLAENKSKVSNEDIFETLTDGLSYIRQKYNVKKFKVDANEGIVSIDDGKKPKKVIREHDLYK